MPRTTRMLLLYPAVAALLAGGVILAITNRPGLPTTAWLQANPGPALALTLTAGFADGVNPCAITTLLLFIGALLAIAEATTQRADARRARRTLYSVAGAYILGIFLLYFALGAGFLNVANLRIFGDTHIFTRLASLMAVLLGLAMMAEATLPGSPIRLTMPAPLHSAARKWSRQTTLGGAFIGGILIGSCTIPCGGAMYLAIAALLAGLASKPYAYTLLTSYNLAFILPLILLVAVAGSRPLLQRLSRLHIGQRSRVKLALGAFVTTVGLFALL